MPGAAPAGVLGTTRSPRSATPGRQAEGRSGTSRESPPDQWTRRRSPRPRARRALRTDETTPVASPAGARGCGRDRKSTRLNSSHDQISYAVFCLKKKKKNDTSAVHEPKNSQTSSTEKHERQRRRS